MLNNSLESTDFLEALLESCPLAIISLTTDGVVTLWSRGAQQLLGWTKEEVVGQTLPSIPARGLEQFQELLETNLQGGHNQGIEVTRNRKDGKSINVSLWTAPLYGPRREVIGKLAVLADITERRRAESERSELLGREQEALQQARSMDRFRELLEAAPDAIVEVDALGQIVLVNTAMEKMFGYSRAELMGSSIDMLLPRDLRSLHEEHRRTFWGNPKTRPMGGSLELFAQRKDGLQIPVEISLSPVRTEDGIRVSAFVRDVTERKQAEEKIRSLDKSFREELFAKNLELAARNKEVERANQLKSGFLSSMSHELRTPLHTISGFAELLIEEMKGPLNESQKRFVEHIQKDSRHLLELINEILDLSKIEAGRLELHLEPFDSCEVIKDTLAGLHHLASNKAITVSEDLNPVWINADRLRFKEVLYNLISNAIKFTPDGGSITVSSKERAEEAFFSVSDTGIGIPPSEQSTIFEEFSQLGPTSRGVREGTGLGLAITKRLIELHNGRIWVESQPGLGSAFYFVLPSDGVALGES
jgi:PAS domain S-box-containing protein